MIEDLDGGDRSPRRGRAVTAISVALALGALAAYAAISSTVFRGPYATPDPRGGIDLNAVGRMRYTPTSLSSADPAAYFGKLGGGCVVPGASYATTVFVGGRSVVFERPITVNSSSWCVIFWADISRQPWERILP